MREVIAELDSAEVLVAAAGRLREKGFTDLDAVTPFPIAELDDALSIRRTRVRFWVLAFGLLGALSAFLVIHLTNAVDYPLNVGGRPLGSYPADVPIVFEAAVLAASSAAFAGVLLGSRLPRLHHRLFEVDGFERTSIDRFWLVVGTVGDEEGPSLVSELEGMGAKVIRS